MRTVLYAAAGAVAIALAGLIALLAADAFGLRIHLAARHGGRTMMVVWACLLAAAGLVFVAAAISYRRRAWERSQLPHDVVDIEEARRPPDP